MKLYKFFIIIVVLKISIQIDYSNYDKFTSAEIDLTFKVLSEEDPIVIRSNLVGEYKNSSIDITSDEHILYLNKDIWREIDTSKLNKTLLKNQEGEILDGFKKKYDAIVGGGYFNKKSYLIRLLPTNIIKDNKKKFHTLGLAHYIDKEKSIVEILYRTKLITKKQFIILFSYPNYGTLSFGEEGTLMSDMKNLRQSCNAVKSKYWGCHLTGIYLGPFEYSNENKAIINDTINSHPIAIGQDTIFDNKLNKIIVPCEVIEYLKKYYFKKYLLSKECNFYEEDNEKYFTCIDSVIENLDKIHFIFDELNDLYIKGKKLFDKNNEFGIVCYTKNSRFILGKPFISSYNTIYSYEEDKITFFGIMNKIVLDKKIEYKEKLEIKQLSPKLYTRDEFKEEPEPNLMSSINILIPIVFGVLVYGIYKKLNNNK